MSETVTFHLTRDKDYRLLHTPSSTQLITDPQTGKQTPYHFPPKYIIFQDFKYETDDQAEIEWLRKQDCVTGRNGCRIDIQEEMRRPAQTPFLSPELQALVDEHGIDKVTSIVKKRVAKQEAAAAAKKAEADAKKASKKADAKKKASVK